MQRIFQIRRTEAGGNANRIFIYRCVGSRSVQALLIFMFDITALGELLIDFTEYGRSDSGMRLYEQNPGGAVANVVCAGARLGLSNAFIGKVGADIHGHFLRSVLESEGINTKNLITQPGCFTTLAFVSLSENGERDFSFYRKGAADMSLTAEEIDFGLIENSRILHLGTLSLTDEPIRQATLASAMAAQRAGAIVSCDINYRASLWESSQDMLKCAMSLLPMVDMLKVTDDEALLLTGEADPVLACDALVRGYGLSLIAVTCGERGAFIKTRQGITRIDAVPADVVDLTGAGDSFWGAFLYAFLSSGMKLSDINPAKAKDFGDFAAAAASLCIESRGAIPALPKLDAVLDKMKRR